jgi:hypothetical protein
VPSGAGRPAMVNLPRLLALAIWSFCAMVLVGAANTNFEAGQRVLPASVTLMAEEVVEPRRNDQETQQTVARKRAADEKASRRLSRVRTADPTLQLKQAYPRREAATARAPPVPQEPTLA